MSDNQPLLSPEELSALTQAVDDGSMAIDTGYNLDKDVYSRDPEDVPQVQFYIAGAPCPAWSAAGPSHGLDDPKNRGVTLFHRLN